MPHRASGALQDPSPAKAHASPPVGCGEAGSGERIAAVKAKTVPGSAAASVATRKSNRPVSITFHRATALDRHFRLLPPRGPKPESGRRHQAGFRANWITAIYLECLLQEVSSCVRSLSNRQVSTLRSTQPGSRKQGCLMAHQLQGEVRCFRPIRLNRPLKPACAMSAMADRAFNA